MDERDVLLREYEDEIAYLRMQLTSMHWQNNNTIDIEQSMPNLDTRGTSQFVQGRFDESFKS